MEALDTIMRTLYTCSNKILYTLETLQILETFSAFRKYFQIDTSEQKVELRREWMETEVCLLEYHLHIFT